MLCGNLGCLHKCPIFGLVPERGICLIFRVFREILYLKALKNQGGREEVPENAFVSFGHFNKIYRCC